MKGRELLSSRRFRAVVIVLAAIAAVWLAGFLWSRAGDPDRILAEPRGPNGELTKRQVERLLLCFDRDWKNLVRRIVYTRSPLWTDGPRVPYQTVAVFFPYRSTPPKLVHEGRAVSRQLLDIALDPQEPVNLRDEAVLALQVLDPCGTLQAFKQPIISGKTPLPIVSTIMQVCVPPQLDSRGRILTLSPPAFVSDLSTKTVDDICLERLDYWVKDPQLTPANGAVLCWLNRYCGVDFDQWLAKNAPDLLAFRNRELRRGCDPVKIPLVNTRDTSDGREERLAKRLYPDESDREASRALWKIWRDNESGKSSDWHATLTRWYNANRSRLVYDPKVMHFVVEPAPVRPEVNLETTDAGGAI